MDNLTESKSVYIDEKNRNKVTLKKGVLFDVSISNDEDYLYQYFTDFELDNSAKELLHIEMYPNEYKKYNNIEDLKESLMDEL